MSGRAWAFALLLAAIVWLAVLGAALALAPWIDGL